MRADGRRGARGLRSPLDLLVEGGRCRGRRRRRRRRRARRGPGRATCSLATGGFGQLFAVTTNPPEATGDGVAMALRAGVAVADVEFQQFHPTALHHPAMPRPLLSEALRGHGALLRDAKGERFVDELLPRDKVSRAITARMLEQGVDHLWLDATGLERFAERFPTITAALAEVGPRPGDRLAARSRRPRTTAAAASSPTSTAPRRCPACGSAGEAACNGVHGANRLASNSLLDGMVFGPRVVEAIDRGVDGPDGHRRHAVACSAAARSAARPLAVPPAGDAHRVGPRGPAAHDDRCTPACCARPSRWSGPRPPVPARSPATTWPPGSCATSPPWAGPCARPPRPARRAVARTPGRTTRTCVPPPHPLCSLGPMTDGRRAARHRALQRRRGPARSVAGGRDGQRDARRCRHRRARPAWRRWRRAVDAAVDGLDHPGAEHHALEQRVRRQPVGAVHAGAGRLARGPQAGQRRGAVEVGDDAAAAVVGGRARPAASRVAGSRPTSASAAAIVGKRSAKLLEAGGVEPDVVDALLEHARP